MARPYRLGLPFVFLIGAGYPARAIIQRDRSSMDDEHVAHPRLYGAPAYARPPLTVTPTALPISPDDLPLAAAQTPEEQALAAGLEERPYLVARPPEPASTDPALPPQSLQLRELAGRILRRAS
jgi:hypothetical protein